MVIAGIGQTEVSGHRVTGSRDPACAVAIILLLSMLALAGCTPKPTEPIQEHSFFSAHAFLDANGNDQLDSQDTPLENATFIVTLQGGAEFGATTDETGYAFVTIPDNVQYPVTLRMEAPKDSSLVPVKPSEIILHEAAGELAKFLFFSE